MRSRENSWVGYNSPWSFLYGPRCTRSALPLLRPNIPQYSPHARLVRGYYSPVVVKSNLNVFSSSVFLYGVLVQFLGYFVKLVVCSLWFEVKNQVHKTAMVHHLLLFANVRKQRCHLVFFFSRDVYCIATMVRGQSMWKHQTFFR